MADEKKKHNYIKSYTNKRPPKSNLKKYNPLKAIGKDLDKRKDPESEYLSHSSKSNKSDNDNQSLDSK